MEGVGKLRVSSRRAPLILLLIIICLAASLIAVSVVLAETKPTLTLMPSEGPPDTLVSIKGENFAPNRYYRVYFDRNNNERWDAGETFRTVRSDAEGKFSTTMTIPLVLSGDYYIRADESPYTPPAVASAKFTVRTVYEKLLDLQGMLNEIKLKLDALNLPTRWGNIVEKNLDEVKEALAKIWAQDVAEVKNYVENALNKLSKIEYISNEINKKLGTFQDEDTVANMLYAVKEEIHEMKAKVKRFSGLITEGSFTIDPTFNPPTQPVAVNYVTGSGTGNINGKSVSLSIEGYLISDWGHYTAMNKGAIVTGWLKVKIGEGNDYIYARVEGMQSEEHRYGPGQTINTMTCTFEIIAGTGSYKGATGSGVIKATIDTKEIKFTAEFEGVIVLR